jgi:predicted phage baseplate assembly protein
MSLPEVNLDDLRFQKDLVDEARKRIVRYCPEWTDYNLSDPGITLIELFAWMTEMMVFRLNKVPEKNYLQFLELLGTSLRPAQSARARLMFRLSAPLPLNPNDETRAVVPQGLEVATQEGPGSPQIIFTTDEPLFVVRPHLTDLRSLDGFNRNYVDSLTSFVSFGEDPPRQRSAFYIGFAAEDDLKGHVMRLLFDCERTEAYGVRRDDPPLVWEVSVGGGAWEELNPSRLEGEQDTTGGLNNESGSLVLYLPDKTKADFVQGLNRTWIRCRYETRRASQGTYSQSPRIRQVRAETLGAAGWSTHAVYRQGEDLGLCTGDAGQIFRLSQSPVLALREGETLEIEEMREGEIVYVPWEVVKDFAESSRYDRHFTLDTSTGEIRLGPAIRQQDGSVKAYGRVPQVGRRVRMNRYRYGGGAVGNVPAYRITMLRSAVPYVDRVFNMEPAYGGRDPETLDEAKLRSRRELRAQDRAVTAEDYESLTLQADPAVARAKCLTPADTGGRLPPGMLELLVVPAAHEAVQLGDYANLTVASPLAKKILDHLDTVRLLTTTLNVREPRYLGVRVSVKVVANDVTAPDVVAARVVDSLRRYLSPLPPLQGEVIQPDADSDEPWMGWPFGKPLFVAEIYSLVQRTPGVRHVLSVHVTSQPVDLGQESSGSLEEFAASVVGGKSVGLPTTVLEGNVLAIGNDTLICSLDHAVEVVSL